MNNELTHYEVLGIREDATAEQIKVAFRKLARTHHPDRNPADPTAETRFKKINGAYSVLSDVATRAAYDGKLAATRKAAAEARVARLAEQARAAAVQKAREAAARRPPAPAPASSSPGWGTFFTLLGVGIVAAAASGGSDRWDSRTGRYHGSDGRFTSG